MSFRGSLRRQFVREAAKIYGPPRRRSSFPLRLVASAAVLLVAGIAGFWVGSGGDDSTLARFPASGAGGSNPPTSKNAAAGDESSTVVSTPARDSVRSNTLSSSAAAPSVDSRLRVESRGGTTLIADDGARWSWISDRRLQLHDGRVYLDVEPRSEPLFIEHRGSEVVVHGTRLVVASEGRAVKVGVGSGEVELANADGSVALGPGEEGVLRATGEPEKWGARRFSHLTSFAQAAIEGTDASDGTNDPSAATVASVATSVEGYSYATARLPNTETTVSAPVLMKYHVDVHIEGDMARTTIDQTFFNPNGTRVEGEFRFPLPPDASISRLAMYVNGQLMEGGMAERSHAVEVYEGIVRKMLDPAILEWMEGSTFRLRVFPLEPRSDRRIVLSYQQSLESLYESDRYRFPLQTPMASWEEFSVQVLIKGGSRPGWRVTTPTYPLERVTAANGDLELAYEAKRIRPPKDVLVDIERPARPEFQVAAFGGELGRFVSVAWTPEVDAPVYRGARRVLLMVDRSGKISAAERDAQGRLAERLLRALDRKDFVNVLTYSVAPEVWNETFVRRDREALRQARAFLEEKSFVGGGDLAASLRRAAEVFGTPQEGDLIFYLGDGVDTLSGLERERLAEILPAEIAFYALPVSRSYDRVLLGALAGRSGGRVVPLSPDGRLGWRAFDLISALRTPTLQTLDASFLDSDGRPVDGSFYSDRQTLRDGETVRWVGRLEGKEPVRLGVGGEEFALVEPETTSGWIPRLWAKLRIEALERDSAAEHRSEIVELSKRYYVMTESTSLLVLENDAMYEQYNIDRGRKDHWARYPAPETWTGRTHVGGWQPVLGSLNDPASMPWGWSHWRTNAHWHDAINRSFFAWQPTGVWQRTTRFGLPEISSPVDVDFFGATTHNAWVSPASKGFVHLLAPRVPAVADNFALGLGADPRLSVYYSFQTALPAGFANAWFTGGGAGGGGFWQGARTGKAPEVEPGALRVLEAALPAVDLELAIGEHDAVRVLLFKAGNRVVFDGDRAVHLRPEGPLVSDPLFDEVIHDSSAVFEWSRVPWFAVPQDRLIAGARVSARVERSTDGAVDVVRIDRGDWTVTELRFRASKPLEVAILLRDGTVIQRVVYDEWVARDGRHLPTHGRVYGPGDELVDGVRYAYDRIAAADIELVAEHTKIPDATPAAITQRAVLQQALELFRVGARSALETFLRQQEDSASAELRKVARLAALRWGADAVIEAPSLDPTSENVRRWLPPNRTPLPRAVREALARGDLSSLAIAVLRETDAKTALETLESVRAEAPSGVRGYVDLLIGSLAAKKGWRLKAYQAFSRALVWPPLQKSTALLDQLSALAQALNEPLSAFEHSLSALDVAAEVGDPRLGERFAKTVELVEKDVALWKEHGRSLLQRWAQASRDDPKPFERLSRYLEDAGELDLAVRYATHVVEHSSTKKTYTALSERLESMGLAERAAACRRIAERKD